KVTSLPSRSRSVFLGSELYFSSKSGALNSGGGVLGFTLGRFTGLSLLLGLSCLGSTESRSTPLVFSWVSAALFKRTITRTAAPPRKRIAPETTEINSPTRFWAGAGQMSVKVGGEVRVERRS